MIVVDSCAWIDYFTGVKTPASEWLAAHFEPSQTLLGDLIALEVLRGFRSDKEYWTAREIFDVLPVALILDISRAIRAAERYHQLRKVGVTIRKSGDVAIASYCIDENVPLLTSDRDFAPFAAHMDLALVVPIDT